MAIACYALPALMAVAALVVSWRAWRKNAVWEALPSLGWTLFMLISFLLQVADFDGESAAHQLVGIILVALTLAAGDSFMANRNGKDKIRACTLPEHPAVKWLPAAFALLAVSLQAYHLWLMPEIPLVKVLLHTQGQPLNVVREQSAKLLPISRLTAYAFNWSMFVFSPLACAMLVSRKKLLSASLLFAWTAFYAVSTTATWPLILFTLLCAAGILPQLSPRTKKRLCVCVLAAAAVASPFLAYAELTGEQSVLTFRVPEPIVENLARQANPKLAPQTIAALYSQPFTWTDHRRTWRDNDQPLLLKTANLLLYRALLVSAEVSHRWYLFFPKVNGGHLGLDGQGGAEAWRGKSPANRVGVWAYTSRFPHKYLDSSSAYAAIDAVAWARFALPGQILICILLLATRCFPAIVGKNPTGSAAYNCFLVMLCFLPAISSFQAMLIANGLAGHMILAVLLPGKSAVASNRNER